MPLEMPPDETHPRGEKCGFSEGRWSPYTIPGGISATQSTNRMAREVCPFHSLASASLSLERAILHKRRKPGDHLATPQSPAYRDGFLLVVWAKLPSGCTPQGQMGCVQASCHFLSPPVPSNPTLEGFLNVSACFQSVS